MSKHLDRLYRYAETTEAAACRADATGDQKRQAIFARAAVRLWERIGQAMLAQPVVPPAGRVAPVCPPDGPPVPCAAPADETRVPCAGGYR